MANFDIVVCTFNGSRFIAEQLASFFRQCTLPTQIIISDDGSTDNTLEIIRHFFAQHHFGDYQIIQGPRLGAKFNYFHALQYSQADYTFLADQDDVWHDDKVMRFMQHFSDEAQTPQLFFSDSALSDEQGKVFMPSYFAYQGLGAHFFDDDSIIFKNCVQGAASCINRAMRELALRSVQVVDIQHLLMHDHWMALLAKYFGRHYFIAEPLIDYRQHGDNEIGVFNKRLRFWQYAKGFSVFYGNLRQLLLQHQALQQFADTEGQPLFTNHPAVYRHVPPLKMRLLRLVAWRMGFTI